MRKLVWAAIGLAAAALEAEYLLPVSGLPYIAAALALLSPAALLLRGVPRRAALLCVLSAAAGCLLWWGRYELRIAPYEALAGAELEVTAVVTDDAQRGDDYERLPVRVTEGAPRGKVLLYLFREELPALEPGDIVSVRMYVVSAMTRNGERVHTQTAAGYSAVGYIRGIDRTGRSGAAFLYFPKRLCRSVKRACDALFPQDAAPFMKALLTGDKDDLYRDEALYGQMRAAGVMHIVAVSGMHLYILFAFLQTILGRGRRFTLVALPAAALFVLMAGCGASVMRAALMQSLVLLAPLFGRESDDATSIAFALIVILLIDPMAVGGIGLQLSFACVLGYLVLLPPMSAWMDRHLPMSSPVVRWAAGSVSGTLCATVFSAPLAAWYFGSVPLLSPLTNLLTVPVVELLFAGGYVVCAVGALTPALGAAGAWLLSWGVRWCRLVFSGAAAVPFGCLYTVDAGTGIWLAATYALFLTWYILRRRGVRASLPIPAELSVIGLCILLLTGGAAPWETEGELAVLDVGQGECVVLLTEDAAVVMDCGGSGLSNAGDLAADYLLSRGRTHVDMLILSHLHEDHTNGAAELLARMPVDYVVYPDGTADEDRMLPGVLEAASRRGAAAVALADETEVDMGELTLTLLLPRAGTDENERGIVTVAALPEASVLMMGDAGRASEIALMERGLIPDADVLIVGHHGSKTATSILFLLAAQPETAIVSVGSNSYGLPAEEVMARLDAYCPTVLRTDEAGIVRLRLTAREYIYG